MRCTVQAMIDRASSTSTARYSGELNMWKKPIVSSTLVQPPYFVLACSSQESYMSASARTVGSAWSMRMPSRLRMPIARIRTRPTFLLWKKR